MPISPTVRQLSREGHGTSLPKPFAWEQGSGEQREGRDLTPVHEVFYFIAFSQQPCEAGGVTALCQIRDGWHRDDGAQLMLPDGEAMEAGSNVPPESKPRAFPISPRIPSRNNMVKNCTLALPLGNRSSRASN